MNKLLGILCVFAILLVGCKDEYDDSEIRGDLSALEQRVQALEELCQQMNTNIASLQALVNAQEQGDYITDVSPVTQGGKTVGYTISFLKSASITIYNGTDGKDGEKGEQGIQGEKGEQGEQGEKGEQGEQGEQGIQGEKGEKGDDGYTPVIGVRQDTDGVYYWTLDGDWLKDDSGNKVKAVGTDGEKGEQGEQGERGEKGEQGEQGEKGEQGEQGQQGSPGTAGKDGITPQLKIENDYWYVSYDNGASWTQLGKATGNTPDSMFESVTEDENYVYITLKGSETIAVPKYKPLSIAFSETEDIRVLPNKTYSISYTLTGSDENTVVKALAQDGFRAVVRETDKQSGVIEVTTPSTILSSEVLVFISDGREHTVMASISFVEGVIVIATKSYTVEYTGGQVDVALQTNIDYTVKIPEDAQSWISLAPASKAVMRDETISFIVQANPSTQMRYTTIELIDNLGVTSETILISQRGGSSQVLNVTTAGTLDQLISAEDAQIIEELKLTGTLNTFDYDFIRTMSNLKSVDLTELDDTKIPASAFANSTIPTVLLPLGLKAIPSRAFYKSSITSIYIPETVEVIEEYAFYETDSLKGNIVIPDATTSIGDRAFQSSAFDGTLTLGQGLQSIGERAFASCSNVIGDLIIPDAVTTMGVNAFYDSHFSGNLVVGDGLTEIPDNAFYSCDFAGSLTLGENIVNIGERSFQDCSGFTGNLIIPDKVEIIGERAFNNCTGFKGYLSIGIGVKSIDDYAFIEGPPGVTGKLNFSRIYCKAPTPPTISSNSFRYDGGIFPSYLGVPTGTIEAYKAAAYWQGFLVIEEMDF